METPRVRAADTPRAVNAIARQIPLARPIPRPRACANIVRRDTRPALPEIGLARPFGACRHIAFTSASRRRPIIAEVSHPFGLFVPIFQPTSVAAV